MSHNAALGSPPHVTAISPVSIEAAGATTITITGGHLSPSCQLEIPVALGTVDGPGVYTATSSTAGELAFPVTALAPPGSPAARVCTLSNGGMGSTGAAVSISHQNWGPANLMIDPADTWLQASDASAVLDGNKVSTVTPGYGNRGALTQNDGAKQMVYKDSVSELNGKPGLTFNAVDVYCSLQNTYPAYILYPHLTAFTLAFVWAPASGSAGSLAKIMQSQPGASYSFPSYSVWWSDDQDELFRWYLAQTNHGPISYGNTGTTTPRRMIMFGGGGNNTDMTMLEPTTGINSTVQVTNTNATSTTDAYPLAIRNTHFAEMILVDRVLDSDERTQLNAYWLARYG